MGLTLAFESRLELLGGFRLFDGGGAWRVCTDRRPSRNLTASRGRGHPKLSPRFRHGSVSLHFAGFRSSPGERQGDIVWDAVQIFNNLATKPEPSRSKLVFPPRVNLGRFAPQGRRPADFGNVDFATTVA